MYPQVFVKLWHSVLLLYFVSFQVEQEQYLQAQAQMAQPLQVPVENSNPVSVIAPVVPTCNQQSTSEG